MIKKNAVIFYNMEIQLFKVTYKVEKVPYEMSHSNRPRQYTVSLIVTWFFLDMKIQLKVSCKVEKMWYKVSFT